MFYQRLAREGGGRVETKITDSQPLPCLALPCREGRLCSNIPPKEYFFLIAFFDVRAWLCPNVSSRLVVSCLVLQFCAVERKERRATEGGGIVLCIRSFLFPSSSLFLLSHHPFSSSFAICLPFILFSSSAPFLHPPPIHCKNKKGKSDLHPHNQSSFPSSRSSILPYSLQSRLTTTHFREHFVTCLRLSREFIIVYSALPSNPSNRHLSRNHFTQLSFKTESLPLHSRQTSYRSLRVCSSAVGCIPTPLPFPRLFDLY